MYNDLYNMVHDNPNGAAELRERLLSTIRTPSRFKMLGDMVDGLGKEGFVTRVVKMTDAKDDQVAATQSLLNTAISYLILDELLFQSGHREARLVEDQEHEDLTNQVKATITEFADGLPGLISYYDALGPRNVHDQLILQCLKLGFLQASSSS